MRTIRRRVHDDASTEVQNRIKRVEARLPRPVIQQGILIEEASSAILQIITLQSTDGTLDEVALGDPLRLNLPAAGCVRLRKAKRKGKGS